jgi:hypothetical protein
VRGARAHGIRCHDHAEAASGGKLQRTLLLDTELGPKDMHGEALELNERRCKANP